MLYGFEVFGVKCGNYFVKFYSDWGVNDKVDIIFINLFFGGVEEDGMEINFL